MPTYTLIGKSGKQHKYTGPRPPTQDEARAFVWERENTWSGKARSLGDSALDFGADTFRKSVDADTYGLGPKTREMSRSIKKEYPIGTPLGSRRESAYQKSDVPSDPEPDTYAGGFRKGLSDYAGDVGRGMFKSYSQPESLGDVLSLATVGMGKVPRRSSPIKNAEVMTEQGLMRRPPPRQTLPSGQPEITDLGPVTEAGLLRARTATPAEPLPPSMGARPPRPYTMQPRPKAITALVAEPPIEPIAPPKPPPAPKPKSNTSLASFTDKQLNDLASMGDERAVAEIASRRAVAPVAPPKPAQPIAPPKPPTPVMTKQGLKPATAPLENMPGIEVKPIQEEFLPWPSTGDDVAKAAWTEDAKRIIKKGSDDQIRAWSDESQRGTGYRWFESKNEAARRGLDTPPVMTEQGLTPVTKAPLEDMPGVGAKPAAEVKAFQGAKAPIADMSDWSASEVKAFHTLPKEMRTPLWQTLYDSFTGRVSRQKAARAVQADPAGAQSLWEMIKDETGAVGNIKAVKARRAGKIPPVATTPKTPILEQPAGKAFSVWINKLRAAKTVEGRLAAREFKPLDALGEQAITDFQAGSRVGQLADVQKFFDRKLAEGRAAGIPINQRDNYLPQLWKEKPAEIRAAFRRLGLKPSFTLERIFEDYAAGKKAGLTPKFEGISPLISVYESRMNKAIADREFYTLAKGQGWIKPKGKGGSDWLDLDTNHFPAVFMKSKATGTVRTVPMTAPPELHEIISNYLKPPNKYLEKSANLSSTTKNLAMSSGVPYTGLNAHGANIWARTVMADPKNIGRVTKYLVNPKTAAKAFDADLPSAPWAMRKGLSLTSEEHQLGSSGSTHMGAQAFQKFLGVTGEMFEDPLFQNVIPATKLKFFNATVDELVKQGIAREEAGTQAADFVNKVYGGINWEAQGRNRDIQNIARTIILAPDWAETNLQLGKGIAKAITTKGTPQSKLYRKMAAGLIGAYILNNAINRATTSAEGEPKNLWENEPGHSLDIYASKSGTKNRWVRSLGTAADFARLPVDMVSGIAQGDLGAPFKIIKNRLSLPLRSVDNIIMNQDDFGRPIHGRDRYGRKIPMRQQIGGVSGELANMVMPPYVKSGIDYLSGRSNLEQAVVGSSEAPVRYSQRRAR